MIRNRPTPEATRRPSVRAVPITLADGQPWGFAAPSTRLRPEVIGGLDDLGRPSDRIRVVSERSYPLAIRRLVADLREACRSEPESARYDAWLALALALLRAAHDLEPDDAAELLEIGPSDLGPLVRSVLAIVSGEPPEEPAPPTEETDDA